MTRPDHQWPDHPRKRPLEVRFWEKVDKRGDDECWPWVASLDNGYGQIGVGGRAGQPDHAHRVSYKLAFGWDSADGLHIHHLCESKKCVNPAHLQALTPSEHAKLHLSQRDDWGATHQTSKTHCPQGHPLSGDNLYVPPGDGSRKCRTCRAERDRRRSQERREQQRPSSAISSLASGVSAAQNRLWLIREHLHTGEWWLAAQSLRDARDQGDHIMVSGSWCGYLGLVPMSKMHSSRLLRLELAGLAVPGRSLREAMRVLPLSLRDPLDQSANDESGPTPESEAA